MMIFIMIMGILRKNKQLFNHVMSRKCSIIAVVMVTGFSVFSYKHLYLNYLCLKWMLCGIIINKTVFLDNDTLFSKTVSTLKLQFVSFVN